MSKGGSPREERSLLRERAQTAAENARVLVADYAEASRHAQGAVDASQSARESRRENPTGVRQKLPKPLVLFVEDDADLRSAHAYALRAAGMDVDEAGSVAEAREALASAIPDVVIADRRLPDGDGFRDVVAVLRRERHGRNVPCIALTGATSEKDIEAAVLSGCDVYLVKPVGLEVVVLRVREQLNAAIMQRRGSV